MGAIKDFLLNDGSNGKRIAAIPLWKSVIHDILSSDASEEGIVRDHNLYSTANTLYSGRKLVTYLYTFDGYPNKLVMDSRESIRGFVSGNTKVAFISTLENEYINWDSASMRSKLKTWQRTDNELKAEEQDAHNFRENMGKLTTTNHRQKSIYYLVDADTNRQRRTFIYRTMMIVSGERGKLFDDQVGKIEHYIKNSLNITANRVDRKLSEFLRAFSPFSAGMTDTIKKEVGKNVLTDELIGRMSSYSQGRVGNGNFYMGTDVISKIPRMHQFRRDPESAENFICCAETGGGKSFYIKTLLLQFIGSNNYNVTINDIEGDEYFPLAEFTEEGDDDVLILNMGEGSGSYFDPTEIIFKDIDTAIENNAYAASSSAVSSIFKTMVYRKDDKWGSSIIDNAVSAAYFRRGIRSDVENIHTWKLSTGMTMFDIYAELTRLRRIVTGKIEVKDEQDELAKSMYHSNKKYGDSFDYVFSQTSNYFHPNGSKRAMFTKRITMNQIANAKLVINSFGLKGKSPAQIDETQLALSQIYAAHISHLRSLSSKEQGRYNVKVWEEFQRWGTIPGSEATLNTALTGGRKLGDINMIISNKLSEIVNNSNGFGILENTQSFAIGAVGENTVRAQFCMKKDVQNLLPELNRIYKETQNKLKESQFVDPNIGGEDGGDDFESMVAGKESGEGSPYERAFLVSTPGDEPTVTKMKLPNAIAKNDLFRTGVDIKKNKTRSASTDVRW